MHSHLGGDRNAVWVRNICRREAGAAYNQHSTALTARPQTTQRSTCALTAEVSWLGSSQFRHFHGRSGDEYARPPQCCLSLQSRDVHGETDRKSCRGEPVLMLALQHERGSHGLCQDRGSDIPDRRSKPRAIPIPYENGEALFLQNMWHLYASSAPLQSGALRDQCCLSRKRQPV